MRALFAVAALVAAAPALAADKIPTAKLDAYYDALAANDFAHGNVVISENGDIKYRRSIGSAIIDPKNGEPNEASTRFKIGPISQLITAVLAMQLVEGASIALDGRVAEFYPDLPNALQLTYRDLLQNRSGLADIAALPDFDGWRTKPKTHAELLAMITAAGPRFPPRARLEYSESNYLVMGYVLEKVYDLPYGEILFKRINAKLGLARTDFGEVATPTNRMAYSYRFTPEGWKPEAQTDGALLGGAGGIVSNTDDLVRIIEAVFDGRLVSGTSLATMRDPEGGSGIGLRPYDIAGQHGVGHAGGTEGYSSALYFFPDRKLAIAYTGNAHKLAMEEIVDETLSLVFDRSRKPPTFAPLSLTEREQTHYAGTWKSAPGTPAQTPFHDFRAPGAPLTLAVKAGASGLTGSLNGRDFPLVSFGDDEFFVRELGYFLHFYPGRDELVLRGADFSHYFKRGG